MLMTEYNQAETMELFKEEGRKEGILDTLISLVKKNLISTKDAAEQAGMSEVVFIQRMTSK